MKIESLLLWALLMATALIGPSPRTFAQSDDEVIEAARSILRADRQAVVAQSMQFTAPEAEDFWPIYEQYRTEMKGVGDKIKKLISEYAGLYPNVPDERAKQMLQQLADLEKKQVATRARYLKKVGKVLPAAKTLRFAQVESRLDLALRLDLAANIPLVPITGEMAGRFSQGSAFVDGTAGGVFVNTLEITANVAAIDTANRQVTLVSPDGIKKSVRVGPDAINFDQIHVGDQVKVTVTEEMVVQMGQKDEATRGASLVALAPKGAKPGGVIAEAVQVTGTVTAIDLANRTATLKFEGGTTRTFPVRRDVDLAQSKVGDTVRFRLTEMVALRVTKP